VPNAAHMATVNALPAAGARNPLDVIFIGSPPWNPPDNRLEMLTSKFRAVLAYQVFALGALSAL
jgi:hypothetical protein